MISGKEIYKIFSVIVPMYVAMILAYASVRWWKIFTLQQCAGINRFVANFAVPVLTFHVIASCNFYEMNYRFIGADSLQKVVILAFLVLWLIFSRKATLEWAVSCFSLSTLPNTLVMGIPLLRAMYGDYSSSLMVQIVVLQGIVWYTLLLVLFEYRAARILILEQFPESAPAITSIKDDPDVVSLSGREHLETRAEIDDTGEIHVVVTRSFTSSLGSSLDEYQEHEGFNFLRHTRRTSDLSGVDIYSLHSWSRASSFHHPDGIYGSQKHAYRSSSKGSTADPVTLHCSKLTSQRNEPITDEATARSGKRGEVHSRSEELMNDFLFPLHQPSCPVLVRSPSEATKMLNAGSMRTGLQMHNLDSTAKGRSRHGGSRIRRSSSVPSSASYVGFQMERAGSKGMRNVPESRDKRSTGDEENGNPVSEKLGGKEVEKDAGNKQGMPPTSVMTKLIFIMAWRKLIRNPNTYSCFLGLAWSLLSVKFHIDLPPIVSGSISIFSNTGLGMAMFSLGLFMGLQPQIIAGGKRMAIYGMALRFVLGPAVMGATSAALGIRHDLLRIAIIQAALPEAIVPFIFAKEYGVYANIMSTAVAFGILVSLPVTLLYHVILQLLPM